MDKYSIIFAFVMKANSTMNKCNQKPNRYNPVVVQQLSEKHGFTKIFIRQCLKGDRNSLTADTIRKEYKDLVKKVTAALNS